MYYLATRKNTYLPSMVDIFLRSQPFIKTFFALIWIVGDIFLWRGILSAGTKLPWRGGPGRGDVGTVNWQFHQGPRAPWICWNQCGLTQWSWGLRGQWGRERVARGSRECWRGLGEGDRRGFSHNIIIYKEFTKTFGGVASSPPIFDIFWYIEDISTIFFWKKIINKFKCYNYKPFWVISVSNFEDNENVRPLLLA